MTARRNAIRLPGSPRRQQRGTLRRRIGPRAGRRDVQQNAAGLIPSFRTHDVYSRVLEEPIQCFDESLEFGFRSVGPEAHRLEETTDDPILVFGKNPQWNFTGPRERRQLSSGGDPSSLPIITLDRASLVRSVSTLRSNTRTEWISSSIRRGPSVSFWPARGADGAIHDPATGRSMMDGRDVAIPRAIVASTQPQWLRSAPRRSLSRCRQASLAALGPEWPSVSPFALQCDPVVAHHRQPIRFRRARCRPRESGRQDSEAWPSPRTRTRAHRSRA